MELDLSWVVSGLLFIPYLVWGVFTLHHRYVRQEELRPGVEAITLLGVAIFYMIEWALLRDWLTGSPVTFFLALMALLLASLALYGHIVLSISSHALLSVVMPSPSEDAHLPQYGPGESCEMAGDFEGAVREYRAVARMFPKEPTAAVRVADNLAKLGEYEDAAMWMERGLLLLPSPRHALPVANRLCDIYARHLERPLDGRRVLETYLQRFPASEHAEMVRARIERMQRPQKQQPF